MRWVNLNDCVYTSTFRYAPMLSHAARLAIWARGRSGRAFCLPGPLAPRWHDVPSNRVPFPEKPPVGRQPVPFQESAATDSGLVTVAARCRERQRGYAVLGHSRLSRDSHR